MSSVEPPAPGPAAPWWRRRITLQWVAAALILLVVALGLFDHYRKHSHNVAATTTTTAVTTSTTGVPVTTPSVALPAAPTKAQTNTPTTATTRPAVGGATTTTGALRNCSTNDVRFSTATGQRSYASGQSVNIVTTLTDVNACIFTPEVAGPYNCQVTLTVNDSSPQQVWPARGQGEQCSQPGGGALEPGATQSVSSTWNGEVLGPNGKLEPAPSGSYTAVGTWGFAGPSGRVIVTPNSPAFTIS